MNKNIIEFIVAFSLVFFIVSSAEADQKYIWTDENGQIRVSETEPDNWGAQDYEETNASQQAEIKRGREESLQETRLKAEEKRRNTVTTTRKKG